MLNAPTDHWEVPNNGRVYVELVNEHATQDAVFTIETPVSVGGLALADRTHTVSATETAVLIGPFPVAQYGETLTITATNQGTKRVVAYRG